MQHPRSARAPAVAAVNHPSSCPFAESQLLAINELALLLAGHQQAPTEAGAMLLQSVHVTVQVQMVSMAM